MLSETEYNDSEDSEDSYVNGINSFINAYSSNENSRNNSYKSNTGEMLMVNNFKLKKKEALKLLNEELKYKLYAMEKLHYVYIYSQVLKELLRYFKEIKKLKLLYSIVLKEIKKQRVYNYGKIYLKFIESL